MSLKHLFSTSDIKKKIERAKNLSLAAYFAGFLSFLYFLKENLIVLLGIPVVFCFIAAFLDAKSESLQEELDKLEEPFSTPSQWPK